MLSKEQIIISLNKTFQKIEDVKDKDIKYFYGQCAIYFSYIRIFKNEFDEEEITSILDKLIIDTDIIYYKELFKNDKTNKLYYLLVIDFNDLICKKGNFKSIKNHFEQLYQVQDNSLTIDDYYELESETSWGWSLLTNEDYYINEGGQYIKYHPSDIEKASGCITMALKYIDYCKKNFTDTDSKFLNIRELRINLPREIYKAIAYIYDFINYIYEDGLKELNLFIENITCINSYICERYEEELEQALQNQYGDPFYKKTEYDDINDELQEIKQTLNKTNTTTNEIKEDTSHIKSKVDEMHEMMVKLTDEIVSYKSFVAPLLKNKEENSDDFEEILVNFQDQIIQKINNKMRDCPSSKSHKQYEEELKIILTEDCFNKLSNESIDFIVTAKTMYDNLSNMDGEYDYSGVCLLLTKALERECKTRFYFGYKNYMQKQYDGNTRNYPLWFIKVARGKETLLPENSFTLGSVAFATGYKRNKEDESDLYLTMNDYCEDELFINTDKEHVKNTLFKIGKEVNTVTNSYRNPAAHINPMAKVKATECFDYLINVEKLLQLIINECKY